jgi:hypothetical protein
MDVRGDSWIDMARVLEGEIRTTYGSMESARRRGVTQKLLASSAIVLFASFALLAQERNLPGRTKVNAKDGLNYVWIPSGKFVMGCSVGDGGSQ